MGSARACSWYWVVVVVVLVTYAAASATAWSARGWSDRGGLAYSQPPAHEAASGVAACRARSEDLNAVGDAVREKFVRGTVAGSSYVACYGIDSYGEVTGVVVLTEPGLRVVTDQGVLQAGGAWPAVAQVSSPGDIVFGGAIMALLGGLYFLYYRRPLSPAPKGPWWATRWVDVPFSLTCFGLVLLWVLPGRSVGRKARVTAQTVFCWMAFVLVVVDGAAFDRPDPVALTVAGLLTAAPVAFWLAGRFILAPAAIPARVGEPQAPQPSLAWPEFRDGRFSG